MTDLPTKHNIATLAGQERHPGPARADRVRADNVIDLPSKRNIETLEERKAYLLAEIARAGNGSSGNAGSFWKRELKALERVIGLANRVMEMSREQQAILTK
jgi:hypothetical protein